MHLSMHIIWGHIWKPTVEKSRTNATNGTNNYGYSNAGNLRRHFKTHGAGKLNKCNQCYYASSYASALRKHLKTHSGEKSNKCNQCDFTSSWARSLRDHLKKHSFSLGTTWTYLSIYECIQYLFVYDINYTNSSRYHPDPNLFDTALTQGPFKA